MSLMKTIASEDLLRLDDEAFRNIVDNDVRNRIDPEISRALRTEPQLARRWYDTLLQMKASVEGQLSAKAAEAKAQKLESIASDQKREGLTAMAAYERWRSGALRFRSGLEATILEAGRFVDEHESEMLRNAIRAHRDHVCGSECTDNFCVADEQLWRLVD